MGDSGSGGVSVRAGPSPRLGSSRTLLRELRRHYGRGDRAPTHTSSIVGCALVCGGCGQLAWSTETDADHPLRREPSTALRVAPACDHCGGTTWVDLQQDEMALAMRDWETHAVRNRRRALVGVVGAGGLAVGIALALVASTAIEGMWALLVPFAMLGVAACLASYRHYTFAATDKPVLPRRWAMALPPAQESTVVAYGKIEATSGLRAPLTGRSCAAFEVGVRVDDDGSAAARTWLLLEQDLGELTVGGHPVDPDRTHLQLRRDLLGLRSRVTLDESAEVFLRQRGFASESGAIVLFESVVQAGDVGKLLEAPDGRSLLRV